MEFHLASLRHRVQEYRIVAGWPFHESARFSNLIHLKLPFFYDYESHLSLLEELTLKKYN
jgi:hypothetical protein